MTKYKVNDEGVQALQDCSKSLNECIDDLESASRILMSVLSENSTGAGPHSDEIEEIADEITQVADRIQAPVDDTCSGLEELAKTYQEIIDSSLRG